MSPVCPASFWCTLSQTFAQNTILKINAPQTRVGLFYHFFNLKTIERRSIYLKTIERRSIFTRRERAQPLEKKMSARTFIVNDLLSDALSRCAVFLTCGKVIIFGYFFRLVCQDWQSGTPELIGEQANHRAQALLRLHCWQWYQDLPSILQERPRLRHGPSLLEVVDNDPYASNVTNTCEFAAWLKRVKFKNAAIFFFFFRTECCNVLYSRKKHLSTPCGPIYFLFSLCFNLIHLFLSCPSCRSTATRQCSTTRKFPIPPVFLSHVLHSF